MSTTLRLGPMRSTRAGGTSCPPLVELGPQPASIAVAAAVMSSVAPGRVYFVRTDPDTSFYEAGF